jgi:hypothetical protein
LRLPTLPGERYPKPVNITVLLHGVHRPRSFPAYLREGDRGIR